MNDIFEQSDDELAELKREFERLREHHQGWHTHGDVPVRAAPAGGAGGATNGDDPDSGAGR